ncbi:MAG: alpha/beta hydrolase family protein, partial [Methyloligellaceae bacterium]
PVVPAGAQRIMSTDPRLQIALSHWAARMVSNGVPLADFNDVTSSLTSWDDWCSAWVAKGEVHDSLARDAEASGFSLSAGEHYTTAAICYHFGKFLFVHDREQMKKAHKAAVASRLNALPFLDPPGERIDIPWRGKTLKGILRKPVAVDRPPVVVMVMGLDSAKEEMHSNEQVFLDRGLATLIFDGPGQGEGEYDFPICPEYEEPVGAVLDWVEERADLDKDNIGIWGVSLGGYYAPRATAFHDRIRACITLSGPFDWGEIFDKIPDLTKSAFLARSFADDEEAARGIANRMTLKECAQQIKCPIYIVAGKRDGVIPYEHCVRLSEEVAGEVVLNMIEDGGHVANNRIYKYRSQSADWMQTILTRAT